MLAACAATQHRTYPFSPHYGIGIWRRLSLSDLFPLPGDTRPIHQVPPPSPKTSTAVCIPPLAVPWVAGGSLSVPLYPSLPPPLFLSSLGLATIHQLGLTADVVVLSRRA